MDALLMMLSPTFMCGRVYFDRKKNAGHGQRNGENMRGNIALTMDVGVKGVQPLLLTQLEDVVLDHLVGVVVEEDVDVTQLLQCRFDHLFACLLGLEVGFESVALSAVLLDQLDRVFCVLLLLWQVCDETVCTFHGEEHGSRASDTRITASDQGLLVLELAGCLIQLVPALGCRNVLDRRGWVHLALKSRHLLVLDIGLEACEISV